MIIRVEKVISFNGQEIRKTAEADIPQDHPQINEIASGLMRSISLPESTPPAATPDSPPPKPREWWLKRCTIHIPILHVRPEEHDADLYPCCKLFHVREVLPDEVKP